MGMAEISAVKLIIIILNGWGNAISGMERGGEMGQLSLGRTPQKEFEFAIWILTTN